MLSPKALVFDMDGTLVDNMSYHKQSWIDLFGYHKLDLDYKTFDRKYHKGSLVEIMARLFPHISDEKNFFAWGAIRSSVSRSLPTPCKSSWRIASIFKKNPSPKFTNGNRYDGRSAQH
jgi:phosphoglycolate phosphatase-like HAD superfamily hydrolase